MPRNHTVENGECIHSIAFENGFFWQTLWDDPNNRELREAREDPSVLQAGDVVHIPDLRETQENPAPVDQRTRFRRRGVPARVRIRLVVDGEALANEPYTLYIDDEEAGRDQTDGDGYVEVPIPPSAREGRLVVGEGEDTDEFVFQLGTVDPIDTEEGVRGRLHNMGYDVEEFEEAVRAFQTEEGIEATGEVDDTTRSRLSEVFGQ